MESRSIRESSAVLVLAEPMYARLLYSAAG